MPSIWFVRPEPKALNNLHQSTACDALGIAVTAVGDDWLEGTMPVDSRTRQPYGLLHGGAAVLLAETLGSAAANACVDTSRQLCVGTEINASHVRAARSGVVTGRATALHVGGRSQLWEIRIHDDRNNLVNVSRLAVSVLDRKST
ncbi:MAG: hotdog fold thioesterase [Pseudomonadales bacterium]|nr:hotdog fold thioesterase [Pseudomonadales bacterium]